MIMKNQMSLEKALEFVESGKVKYRIANLLYPCITLENAIEYPKIINYAVATYNILVSNLENWLLNIECFHMKRGIVHPPYDNVHSNSIDTGTISKKAYEMKKIDPNFQTTKEHVYMPQQMMRLALDEHEKYLKYPEEFFKLFIKCCQTREVTAEENRKLSGFLRSGEVINGKKYDKIQIKSPLSSKYKECGIEMLKREKGRGWKDKPVYPVDSTIVTPQGYDEYEAQFLVDEFK